MNFGSATPVSSFVSSTPAFSFGSATSLLENFGATSSNIDLKLTVLHANWKVNFNFPVSLQYGSPTGGHYGSPGLHDHTSTTFSFLDNVWNLNFQARETSRELYLCFGKPQKMCGTVPVTSSTPAEPFVVTVHVESATTGQVLRALTSITKINSEASLIYIWKRSSMEMERASPEFKTNSEVKFILVFEATGNNSTSALSSSVLPVYVPCLESLSEDFSKLLEQGQNNPDIEFQCGGKSTKAHGNVVSSRSQVIAKMLATDMVEGRTKVVRIPDLKPDIFEKFLRYLYTGKLDELTFEVALDLFEAGDQYAVTGLAKRCSEYLVEHLSMQNVCAVLVIADAHSNESLVEKVVDYMVDNRVPVASEDWPAFCDEHPRLANKVLNRGWAVLSPTVKSTNSIVPTPLLVLQKAGSIPDPLIPADETYLTRRENCRDSLSLDSRPEKRGTIKKAFRRVAR